MLLCHIETSRPPKNEDFLENGGLDTLLQKHSGLLDHRREETKKRRVSQMSGQALLSCKLLN